MSELAFRDWMGLVIVSMILLGILYSAEWWKKIREIREDRGLWRAGFEVAVDSCMLAFAGWFLFAIWQSSPWYVIISAGGCAALILAVDYFQKRSLNQVG